MIAARTVTGGAGVAEQRTGQRDGSWPVRYAAYRVAEQAGTPPAHLTGEAR